MRQEGVRAQRGCPGSAARALPAPRKVGVLPRRPSSEHRKTAAGRRGESRSSTTVKFSFSAGNRRTARLSPRILHGQHRFLKALPVAARTGFRPSRRRCARPARAIPAAVLTSRKRCGCLSRLLGSGVSPLGGHKRVVVPCHRHAKPALRDLESALQVSLGGFSAGLDRGLDKCLRRSPDERPPTPR